MVLAGEGHLTMTPLALSAPIQVNHRKPPSSHRCVQRTEKRPISRGFFSYPPSPHLPAPRPIPSFTAFSTPQLARSQHHPHFVSEQTT